MNNQPLQALPPVTAWLDAFARCVRERDYESARLLFSPEAQGFGTITGTYDGIEDLHDNQWGEVWKRTTDFAFITDDGGCVGDGSAISVWCRWSSIGIDGNGRQHQRTGRATFALVDHDGHLRANHSHLSMDPGQVG